MTVLTDPSAIDAALSLTWPPKTVHRQGGWTLRRSDGGGKRVTAATLDGADMTNPPSLVRIREGQDRLDRHLVGLGYGIVDPTLFRMAPVERLARKPGPAEFLPSWPPLGAAKRLWKASGIGEDRLVVMERAIGPKAAALGRAGDAPLAVAFVAVSEGIAFVHALEVQSKVRRKGVASALMAHLAHWAAKHHATEIAVAVTEANGPANALYNRLGMQIVGRYHYRSRP